MDTPTVSKASCKSRKTNSCCAGLSQICALWILPLVLLPHIHAVSPKVEAPPGLTEEWYRCHGLPCHVLENDVRKPMFRLKKRLAALQGVPFEPTAPSPEDDMLEDMYLSPAMVQALEDANSPRHKRKLHQPNSYREKWPIPIHYQFDGNHTAVEMDRIRGAIRHWEAQTCIRFRDMTGTGYQGPGIIFIKQSGCASFIGYNWLEQPQPVDLIAWCTERLGTIAHEIGHVIGFWHEHQRSDRDQFVTIMTDEVKYGIPYYQSILRRATDTRNWQPYDYTSAMHYWSKSGSRKGAITIQTKDKLFQRTIGQATGLSFLDVKTACQEYCNDTCKNVHLPLPCANGGFQNPNDCSRCRCPDGLGGTFCEELATSRPGCGGEIFLAQGDQQTITSPGYFRHGYNPRDECNWRIRAPAGQKISMRFQGPFGVFCADKGPTCFHWVEVKTDERMWMPGPRFCCTDTPTQTLTSDTNIMVVTFRSNFTYKVDCSKNDQCRGFSAQIVAGDASSFRGPPIPTPVWRNAQTDAPTTTSSTTSTTLSTTTPTTSRPTPPEQTERPVSERVCDVIDLAFVLDSSGKPVGGKRDWLEMLRFVRNFARLFPISRHQVRVGVVSYGNRGTLAIALNDFYDYGSFETAVNSFRIPFKDQMTNTADGLRVMRSKLFSKEHGDRDYAPNVAILVTEGRSNRQEVLTQTEAVAAREDEIIMFAIGVTKGVSEHELQAIVGGKESESGRYITLLDKMSDLQTSRASVYDKLCNELERLSGRPGARIPPPPPNTPPPPPPTTTTSTTTTTTQRPTTPTPRPTPRPTPKPKRRIVQRLEGPLGACSGTCGGCGRVASSIYCVYDNGFREHCGTKTYPCETSAPPCSCMKYVGKFYRDPDCNECCSSHKLVIQGHNLVCVRN